MNNALILHPFTINLLFILARHFYYRRLFRTGGNLKRPSNSVFEAFQKLGLDHEKPGSENR